MTTGLVWTVVGSVAGVAAVLAAVIFGILQLRQGKKSRAARESGSRQSIRAGRDAYTAGGDQYITQDRRDEN
jgi:negative regulator of sigma E activity